MLRRSAAALGALSFLAFALPAAAQPVDLPVLGRHVPRGSGETNAEAPVAPTPKVIDGLIEDWTGRSTMFGGTAAYSAGELVYQDHLFDPYGPDDGEDARRMAILDPAAKTVPETYRVDPLMQADIPGEQLGTPVSTGRTNYGDLPRQDHSDLLELRIAASDASLQILARTTGMAAPDTTAVLLLADTKESDNEREVPFNSGLTTKRADVAVLLASGTGWVADLGSGDVSELPAGSVATNPSDYVNAIEASVARELLIRPGKEYKGQGKGGEHGAAFRDRLSLAAATGTFDPATGTLADLGLDANVANVAFRFEEPVRGEWFEKNQALTLERGTIDPFFTDIDLDRLTAGYTETYVPGPGYHDRIFISAAEISREQDDEGRLRPEDGIHQHYGLFLPSAVSSGDSLPLQFWLHWRGGNAHTASSQVPRVFKHFGEDQGTVVAAPAGRGTSRWYVGKGHVDFLEVWNDVHRTVSVDADRTYVTGHSMGGWGSYLLPILYPDRFAGAAPVAGPVTQGAWFGCDFNQCYTGANGGNARVQHTRRLLENLLHVPYAILHGAADELVPVAGVTRQAERFQQLGYRHRYYLYPTYEHFSHPINDEWADAARYLHRFKRPENPAQVTYIRDMPFELATETIQSDGVPLNFDFDRAYWMSQLTPVDPENGVARFDGKSLAIENPAHTAIPDAGGPTAVGQTGPFVMVGTQWLMGQSAATSNAFDVSLKGAAAVRLDLLRMAIDPGSAIEGQVTTDGPLELRLFGGWATPPPVTVGGEPVPVTLTDGVLTIPLPAGSSQLQIG